MGLLYGWSITLAAAVVLSVGLYHLGLDVPATISSSLRQVEHVLGQPLLPP